MVQSIRRKRGQSIVINGVTIEIKCIWPGHVILHVTGGTAARAENVDPRKNLSKPKV